MICFPDLLPGDLDTDVPIGAPVVVCGYTGPAIALTSPQFARLVAKAATDGPVIGRRAVLLAIDPEGDASVDSAAAPGGRQQ